MNASRSPLHHGAILLCGGQSTRMGQDKATLPFGPECMLQRVLRLVSTVVPLEHVVVVAAVGQALPELPSAVSIVRDHEPARGPLLGLIAGLRGLPPTVQAAYATSCDVPLLQPAFVRQMFALLETANPPALIAVPRDHEFHHPLAAVYRPAVLAAAEQLLAQGRPRLRFLFDVVATREVPVDDLRSVDPELLTLRNLNTPADYQAALAVSGIATRTKDSP